MRVLFDQGTPAPLRHLFLGHVVSTAFEVDWATLKNGELLTAAENQGFEVFVTTDTHLKLPAKSCIKKNCHRRSRHHELATH
jgi:hypothetical protein